MKLTKRILFSLAVLFLVTASAFCDGETNYYSIGNVKARNGDLDGAIDDYTKAIELKSDDAKAYNNRGLTKDKKGDLDGALADLSKAIVLNPKLAQIYFNRGNVKKEKNDLNGAIADYTKAIELKTDYVAAYDNRGTLKKTQGDLDGAIVDYAKAIELKPDYSYAYNNRGLAKASKGDLDDALADYSKAIDLNPTFAEPYYNRGLVKQANGDLDNAHADFTRAIELSPKMREMIVTNGYLMSTQSSQTNLQKEAMAAQKYDANGIGRFHRLDELAKSAFEVGEIEKASQYAKELLETAQKYPKDWNYGNAVHDGNNVLGRIALKQGDIKQADEYLLKAGRTLGSPTLNSFGPNMSLAKELLEKGETNAVLQYFELCQKFWSMGGEKLDDWTKEVKMGITPSFGPNLSY
jgi:tetratricopeptide (TPR) repeat protein